MILRLATFICFFLLVRDLSAQNLDNSNWQAVAHPREGFSANLVER